MRTVAAPGNETALEALMTGSAKILTGSTFVWAPVSEVVKFPPSQRFSVLAIPPVTTRAALLSLVAGPPVLTVNPWITGPTSSTTPPLPVAPGAVIVNVPLAVMLAGVTAKKEGTTIPILVTVPVVGTCQLKLLPLLVNTDAGPAPILDSPVPPLVKGRGAPESVTANVPLLVMAEGVTERKGGTLRPT